MEGCLWGEELEETLDGLAESSEEEGPADTPSTPANCPCDKFLLAGKALRGVVASCAGWAAVSRLRDGLVICLGQSAAAVIAGVTSCTSHGEVVGTPK